MISFAILFGLVVLDWLTKQWALKRSLVVWNEGGVWGILPGEWWLPMTVVVIGVLLGLLRVKKMNLANLALVFILAGGIGNFTDRLIYGAVRDFIYYPLLQVYGNLADIYLGLGIILLIYQELKRSRVCQK